MRNPKSLLSWLLLEPLKFAIISLIFIFLFIFFMNLIYSDANNLTMILLTLIASICSAAIVFPKLPNKNMTQHGFVALNNAQAIIMSTLFMVAVLLINKYQTIIVQKLWLLNIKFNPIVIILTILAGLFLLYLIGIFVINVYAKYIRCREMKIAPWQIILSMPFGFSLLWIPGYLLKEENKSISAVSIHTKWYSNFTKKLINKPFYITLTFILITIYSGFFYGFNMVFLTLLSTTLFLIWFRITGLSKFRLQQRKLYSYIAIVLNVIIFVSLITLFSQSIPRNETINIRDIEIVQESN